MSKRVANSRAKNKARNGRVRYHWTTQRKQQAQRPPETVPDVVIQEPRKPTLMDRAKRMFRHQKRGS